METSSLKLYYDVLSQPCRSVKNVLDLLKVKHEIVEIKIATGDTKKEDYRKINPQGLIPAINDNGFILGESEAVVRYILNTRPGGEKLYPADPKTRSQIDRYFPFHHSSVRPVLSEIMLATHPFISKDRKFDLEATQRKTEQTLKQFNEFYLQGKKFIAGDELTIADLFAFNELVSLYLNLDYDLSKQPAVKEYVDRILNLPFMEEIMKQVKEGAVFLKSIFEKMKGVEQ